MILRWTDRDYGQHYLPIKGEVVLLGNYGHDESRPNHGRLYGRSTAVWADPPADGAATGTETVQKDDAGRLRYVRTRPDVPAVRGEIMGEYGDDESGDQELLVAGTKETTIAVIFAPDYGDPEDGILQISCLALYLTTDTGDTIDTLIRERR